MIEDIFYVILGGEHRKTAARIITADIVVASETFVTMCADYTYVYLYAFVQGEGELYRRITLDKKMG